MWQLHQSVAKADLGAISLTVSLAEGDRSVLVKTADDLLVATLWDLSQLTGQPLTDAYVRGDDLVCSLGASEAFPFATQLYWTPRTLEVDPQSLATLSLLISVRTDLLDTEPTIEVTSQAPYRRADTIETTEGPAYLLALREKLSLVEYAAPEDCQSQSLVEQSEGIATVERTLFGHFLEKGVIRCGRLHAAVTEGEVTAAEAQALCSQLAAADLPLTT